MQYRPYGVHCVPRVSFLIKAAQVPLLHQKLGTMRVLKVAPSLQEWRWVPPQSRAHTIDEPVCRRSANIQLPLPPEPSTEWFTL
jgi:hypothetical protein